MKSATKRGRGRSWISAGTPTCITRPSRRQAEGDVVEHGQVREQRVVLEDHAEPAALGRQVIDRASIEPDLAARGRKQPGQQVQRGGLAAARRPQEGDELAAVYVEREL